MERCLYCNSPADSLEHTLPAAFGEFENAPELLNRVCAKCNNTTLGRLDEQLARCGPEGFLRKFFGVQGRPSHDKVNPFERGSAGGQRLDMRAWDGNLGVEVALEFDNGRPRNMREIVVVEESGKHHHLPIREGTSPEQLWTALSKLGIVEPVATIRYFYGPEEKEWVEALLKKVWPEVIFTEGDSHSSTTIYEGAIGKVEVTDRYYRAITKIGFHYFLTQFPAYNGREPMFRDVREFIAEDGEIDRANDFVRRVSNPLFPKRWREHILRAGTVLGGCGAIVQMFVSKEWPAPEYQIQLARDSSLTDFRAAGHSYRYYSEGDTPKPGYSGEAHRLELATD